MARRFLKRDVTLRQSPADKDMEHLKALLHRLETELQPGGGAEKGIDRLCKSLNP